MLSFYSGCVCLVTGDSNLISPSFAWCCSWSQALSGGPSGWTLTQWLSVSLQQECRCTAHVPRQHQAPPSVLNQPLSLALRTWLFTCPAPGPSSSPDHSASSWWHRGLLLSGPRALGIGASPINCECTRRTFLVYDFTESNIGVNLP